MIGYPARTIRVPFADIDRSTRQQSGGACKQLLANHHRLIRAETKQAGGVEASTAGDSFFTVFSPAIQALEGAMAA
jgi:class 3 adenylate cyclase